MYAFLKSLFALLGVLSVIALIAVPCIDFYNMLPNNGDYPKGNGKVLSGEAVDFDSLDTTPTGFVKKGYLIDLVLECYSGELNVAVFHWQWTLGKVGETYVRQHNPQDACRKRGIMTLI